MKKIMRRAASLFFAVLVLAMCFPFSAFAVVDPVSASAMANAMAQAIAAYGASNGVAMTFDVASTDGIGESVHELWKDFRAGTQDADDYATLAAALFPELYYKAAVAVGTAADVYTVGYNISTTYAEEFDNFFDWLLSGPAEMVKVDNAYQFASAQIGANAVPITVNTITIAQLGTLPLVPVHIGTSWNLYKDGTHGVATVTSITNGPVYAYAVNPGPTTIYLQLINYSVLDGQVVVHISDWDYSEHDYTYRISSNLLASDGRTSINGFHWLQAGEGYGLASPSWSAYDGQVIPAEFGVTANSTVDSASDVVGVKAYGNTGVAEFPDTSDPNYEAVAKQIPSTYPWDNSLYGDGSGTITDAQAGAIAAEAAGALATDGVIELAGTTTADPGGPGGDDDPSSDDPDDYLAVGLEDIFPFCIPFDIYNFLSALAADPVAPHFTASLAFPQAVGGTQTIDIDFDSPTWNQLAQLLRLLELLAFIVGLALLTRSMFIRG